jgi:TDG/mug DNA glycosylase family protein
MIKYKFSFGLKILFVGINPHYGSFKRGVPFSNNKMFWYLLNKADIIDEKFEDLKNDVRLREIYETKFCPVYKLGFVNLINRPTQDVSQLKKGEEIHGRKRILSTIVKYKPRIVCFIGKVTYEKFSNSKNFDFGWQNGLGETKVYVMHFPLRGKASIRIRELKMLRTIADRSWSTA